MGMTFEIDWILDFSVKHDNSSESRELVFDELENDLIR